MHRACLTNINGINTLRPGQNGRHFADDIFKCIFLNENASIPTKISLMFVPKGPINNTPALIHIMAWCRPGDKPLSETMMVSLPMHISYICVTRPQWVKTNLQIHQWFDIRSICQKHAEIINWHIFLISYNFFHVTNYSLTLICKTKLRFCITTA